MSQDTVAIDEKTTLDFRSGSGKSVVAGCVVTMLVAYVLCICLLLFWKHGFSPVAQVGIFLLAGAVHVTILRRGFASVSVAKEWIYTLAMACLLLVLFGSSFVWGLRLSLRLPLFAACTFLLPFVLTEMWRAKLYLAYEGAKYWYPTTEALKEYPSFYFNSMPVRFRIRQGRGEPGVSIRFNVSNEMHLGGIFYDLAQNKARKRGRAVALTDANKKPFHWVFYTADRLVLNRALDPEKSLRENGLEENAVIYVQRVFAEDMAPLVNNKN